MSDHAYPGHDLEALSELHNYQRWILREYTPWLAGRVLEVGAGIGAISSHYLQSPAVRHATLIEPSSEMHARLQSRFADDSRVTTFHGTLDDWLAAHPQETDAFDAAIMVNVLEHVPDDQTLLTQLHRLVRPGGALLIFVPAHAWLYGSLDHVVQHIRRYERKGLVSLAKTAGFQVRDCRYFDIAGVLPWWFVGRVLKPSTFHEGSARTYDRFVVPLMSRIEPRLNLPVGKNLSLIGIRPA